MSETALMTQGSFPVTKYAGDQKQFEEVAASTAFLPRLQLYGNNNEAVKDGKIPMGRYGVVRAKDIIEDLGDQIDCLPISWRYKAVEYLDDSVITKYNPADPEFKRIKIKADQPGLNGAQAGIEFLLWIPDLKSFVTFFMGNKSSRREAGPLRGFQEAGAAASLKITLATKGKFKWHAPVITSCSSPLDLPDPEKAMEEANKFANPKETAIESVSKAEQAATSRAQ